MADAGTADDREGDVYHDPFNTDIDEDPYPVRTRPRDEAPL